MAELRKATLLGKGDKGPSSFNFILPDTEMISIIVLADNEVQLCRDFKQRYLNNMSRDELKELVKGLDITIELIAQSIWWLNAHKSWEQLRHNHRVLENLINKMITEDETPEPVGKTKEIKECCICGKGLNQYTMNNARPLFEGCCCNECNDRYVIPARLAALAPDEKKLNKIKKQVDKLQRKARLSKAKK